MPVRHPALPGPVRILCDRFLSLAPEGLVTGLYLTGGIGFGEWVEDQSDIDFIATLDHRPTTEEVNQLEQVHEQLAAVSTVDFDGMHVLTADLSRDPRELPLVPVVLHQDFSLAHLDQLVAWHELAWHGITVSGPERTALGIWTDARVLHAHTVDNLDTYWRDIAGQLAAASPDEPRAARDDACCWCVLGVARLHHLVVSGAMTDEVGGSALGPVVLRRTLAPGGPRGAAPARGRATAVRRPGAAAARHDRLHCVRGRVRHWPSAAPSGVSRARHSSHPRARPLRWCGRRRPGPARRGRP